MVVDDDVDDDDDVVVDVDVAVLAKTVVRARLAGVSEGQLMEMDDLASCIWPETDPEPLLSSLPGLLVGVGTLDPEPEPEPDPLPLPSDPVSGRGFGTKMAHCA